MDNRRRRNLVRMSRIHHRAITMDSEEFRRNYRVSKELFYALLDDLSPHMKKQTRRSDITIESKILTALAFYASGSYQKIVGRSGGISQQSVTRVTREVTEALNHSDIITKYIRFPATSEERNAITIKFYEKFQIPGVIGVLDGTHVAIVRPKENEERYFNRKHYHSRNVQNICDSEMNILNGNAAFGGATHDSFIFNNHPVKEHLAGLIRSGENIYLLGDSGYPQREYLMTPITSTVAGSPEEYYSMKHRLARNTIERTIGLLKARLRCLLRHRVLHYDPYISGKIINACCVLHNLCNRHNCPAPAIPEAIIDENNDTHTLSLPHNDELRRGQEARLELVQSLWRSRETIR